MPKSRSSVGVGLANWRIGEIGYTGIQLTLKNNDNNLAARTIIDVTLIHGSHGIMKHILVPLR